MENVIPYIYCHIKEYIKHEAKLLIDRQYAYIESIFLPVMMYYDEYELYIEELFSSL